MFIQKSYKETDEGVLYLIPTPIGNLEDMTYRAVRMLSEVSVIAAEDTRHSQKLLSHFDIHTPLISYHEHSKQSRIDLLIKRLKEGEDVGLVSDAGMPAISDPGYEVVKAALEEKLNVVTLPGANAALCALVSSGLSTEEYLFYGFLPRKKKERQAEMQRLAKLKGTVLMYESPYRLKDTLGELVKIYGDRQVVVAREITKLYEEYIRGSFTEVIEGLSELEIKGECCLVIEGNNNEDVELEDLWWRHLSILEHVLYYEEEKGMKNKAAMKEVAVDRNMSRRDVYQIIHVEK
ncbi:MAG TPA: 16S rRNA (cytidine(1402)-2'-O)-methyltransferase [Pseudogracilibacillus sp.]|nr:16S rRNA (cytidine(1402)-2'-O)-methyltransferase [Pseudogracilibacillus sp.]